MNSKRLGIAAVLALTGCVAHSPISETVMFHAPETSPTHHKTIGGGLVGTLAPNPIDPAPGPNGSADRPRAAINGNGLSGGLYLASYDDDGRAALAFTAGAMVAGLDVSFRVYRRNYLTAAISAPGHRQLFLNHRAYNSPELGAAVGIGYKHLGFAYEPGYSCSVCVDFEFHDSFGARAFAILRAKDDTGGGIKISTYAGYVPVSRRSVFSMSLTVGGF